MAKKKKKGTTKKKATKAKTATAKTAAKKPEVTLGALKVAAATKPRTKGQIYSLICEDTGCSRRQIAQVFDTLEKVIRADMSPRGPKAFTVPNLMKITVKRKPATKARKGINPFTGEEMMFKAKPARNVVKVRPLKKLKDMV